MSRTKKQLLLALVGVLVVFVALMQNNLDPMRRKYQPGKVANLELGAEFVSATLIGLKEVVAGLLWVRTDEFFHTGNYEAVMPMVRIITWLDPHQIDVYDTGAWHLSYNFTDSQERSDRRYIPASRALLREGIINNPSTYDLYFSLGWLNFNKIQDYKQSIIWFGQANTKEAVDAATGKKMDRPEYVGHELAHALERSGQPELAIEQWKKNLVANEEYARKYSEGTTVMVDVARNNLNRVIEQKAQRDKLKPTLKVGFEAHWEPISPRKFRVWGTINLADGARVRLRLTDRNFKEEEFESFTWNVNSKQTILIDDLYVRQGKFSRTIDIERDAAIYPLLADEDTLAFVFNPMTAPDFVQDKTGWLGNGLAPQKYCVQRGNVRMLEKDFLIKRSQLL